MLKTGHCHCGAVSYVVDGEPVRMGQCHCNACRRTTGTGHGVQAFFRRDSVAISGVTATHESISDKGNVRTRHFCPTCGSRLFSENASAPDFIGIAAGSFDNSDWFSPKSIVYAAERPVWDCEHPDVETRERG